MTRPERSSEAPKPREVTKQETREALILAGIAAFAEEGLDGPSLDSICARAGYTRGAFYVHFKDRDDFLAAVMQHVLGAFVDAIITSDGSASNLERTIHLFVEAAQNGEFPLRRAIPMHQFMAACARSSVLREQYIRVLTGAMQRVATVARQGQEAGSLRSDVAPERFGLLLILLAMGLQSLLEAGYELDIGSAASDLLKILRPPGRAARE